MVTIMHAQLCPALCEPMDCSPPGSSAMVFSRQEYCETGCHFQLQGIFPTQGSSPEAPALERKFFITEPPGKLNMVTQDQTQVSHIAGGFFTS